MRTLKELVVIMVGVVLISLVTNLCVDFLRLNSSCEYLLGGSACEAETLDEPEPCQNCFTQTEM